MRLVYAWRLRRPGDLKCAQNKSIASMGTLLGACLSVAMLIVGVFGSTAAYAEGAREWGQRGPFARHRDQYHDVAKKRHLANVKPRIRTTNLGGIEVVRAPTRRVRRKLRRNRVRTQRRYRRASLQRKRTLRRRRSRYRNRRRVRIASLGGSFQMPAASRSKSKRVATSRSKRTRSITRSRGIQWSARSGCLNSRLRAAVYAVARNFGRVRVNSTCRSRRHNRRVGGARRSKHLTGDAADIRVFGNVRGAARYLRRIVGGYKHYGGGRFHIDTGSRRTW